MSRVDTFAARHEIAETETGKWAAAIGDRLKIELPLIPRRHELPNLMDDLERDTEIAQSVCAFVRALAIAVGVPDDAPAPEPEPELEPAPEPAPKRRARRK